MSTVKRRVQEINNVIPHNNRKTSLESFIKQGFTEIEAYEMIDRIGMQDYSNHRYSSQFLHVEGKPVTTMKQLKYQDYEN